MTGDLGICGVVAQGTQEGGGKPVHHPCVSRYLLVGWPGGANGLMALRHKAQKIRARAKISAGGYTFRVL